MDEIVQELTGLKDKAVDAVDNLKAIQEEYEEWYENTPQSLQDSPTGTKLQEVIGIEIECSDFDEAVEAMERIRDEASGIDLPRGFGQD